MPQGGEYNPSSSFPVARRVNSSHSIMMEDDMETGTLGAYQDKLRTFPNMRTKPYTPLVSSFLPFNTDQVATATTSPYQQTPLPSYSSPPSSLLCISYACLLPFFCRYFVFYLVSMFVSSSFFCSSAWELSFTSELLLLQSSSLSSLFVFSASLWPYILQSGSSQKMRGLLKWFR